MCASCTTLRQALEDSHASEQELQRNIEALQAQLLRTARAEQAARAELTKQREDSPRAVEIRSVLDHYVQKFGKTKSYKVGSDTARWKSVDRMLKLGYSTDELREAIDGLHALPFVGPKGRQAQGGERHDDVTLCFRDETHVDRFRGYAQRPPPPPEPIPIRPRSPRPRPSDWSYAPIEIENALLSALAGRGCSWDEKGAGWIAQCPAHDDRNPSLSIAWNGAEDRLLIKCWAGCEVPYVMDALGLSLSALFRDVRSAA